MRGLLRAAVAASVLAAAAVGAPGAGTAAQAAQQAAATPRPNIVVIMTDDQPVGMLDAMPNVRALLAQQGVTYPNAIVPTSLCCPSRTSFLTGRYSHSTGIYTNSAPLGGWSGYDASGYENDSLPVWLHAAGYRTALVGKYLNGMSFSDPQYVPPGWDTYVGLEDGRGRYFTYSLRVHRNGTTTEQSYGNAPEDYATDVLSTYAQEEIAATPAGQPLFLYFAPNAPHAPARPAPRYRNTWPAEQLTSPAVAESDLTDKPPWVQALAQPDLAAQAALATRMHETLRSVDDAVGAMVRALGARAQNTLFVFTSDNGYLFGEHHVTAKSVAYRAATEVPLVLRWNGHLPAGTVDPRLAANIDVTATIRQAAGLGPRGEGMSLLQPTVRQGSVLEAVDGRRRPGYCGWRTARWLFVEYSGNQGRELYDYQSDPYELDNLARDPAYATQVRWARRQAHEACTPAPPGFTW